MNEADDREFEIMLALIEKCYGAQEEWKIGYALVNLLEVISENDPDRFSTLLTHVVDTLLYTEMVVVSITDGQPADPEYIEDQARQFRDMLDKVNQDPEDEEEK